MYMHRHTHNRSENRGVAKLTTEGFPFYLRNSVYDVQSTISLEDMIDYIRTADARLKHDIPSAASFQFYCRLHQRPNLPTFACRRFSQWWHTTRMKS